MLTVDIVVPVFNAERVLPASVAELAAFVAGASGFAGHIVIADNASTDRTLAVARELARERANVEVMHVAEQGRGRALKAAWARSRADVLSYMDVDLSSNLNFFPLLIHGLSIGYDLAVGSRLLQASQTERSLKREVISQAYNLLVKAMFWNRFSDAQCGFKAGTREVVQRLARTARDESWFFDTELMLLAERGGAKIFEVPVEWVEDLDSRVHIVRTALADVRGLLRLRCGGLRQALRTCRDGRQLAGA